LTFWKTVVACLALANVGYFLWQRNFAEAAPVSEAIAPGGLQLASESAANPHLEAGAALGTNPAAAPSGEASQEEPPQSSGVRRCVSVGPFRDMAEAAHAASTLRTGGYDPRQRVAEGDVWAGVWVYLPLPAARSVAEQTMGKLKAGGIDDALEMPGPNDGPVISLGLFSEQKRALARVAQAQGLGLNPGMADRKRSGNVYWIDIDLKPSDALLNPADLQGERGRIMRLEVKGCPVAGGAP
jgi:hypothetical protein